MQTLPFARLSETTQSAMTSSSPEIVGTEPTREEKTEAAVPAERAKTQVGRKRREQPLLRHDKHHPTTEKAATNEVEVDEEDDKNGEVGGGDSNTPFAYKHGEAGEMNP